MLKRAAITRLGTGALATCSALALSNALAGEFPKGTYETQKAPYTVRFDDKGQFQVNQGETLEVKGTYSVKAGQLKLTDAQGPWACTKEGEQTGTYTWKFENAVLTLSKVADKCEDRVKSLVDLAWKRQH